MQHKAPEAALDVSRKLLKAMLSHAYMAHEFRSYADAQAYQDAIMRLRNVENRSPCSSGKIVLALSNDFRVLYWIRELLSTVSDELIAIRGEGEVAYEAGCADSDIAELFPLPDDIDELFHALSDPKQPDDLLTKLKLFKRGYLIWYYKGFHIRLDPEGARAEFERLHAEQGHLLSAHHRAVLARIGE
jgi:hypothetical protein